tara:strand:+ start:244 stop:1329 length:1086 start_codon:yes stop_codon:yes gene_type:complete
MKTIATLLSIGFAALVALIWYQEHTFYLPNENELLNDADVAQHLQQFDLTHERYAQIPTGIYLDSLHFKSANDVYVSGYVWQEFAPENLGSIREGVIFPDAVETLTIEEAYRINVDGVTVVGWYFEANLRQAFVYKNYPIDHKTIWIKLLPKDFDSSVVLVPSFRSYENISPGSSFGLATDILLEGWSVDETYFDLVAVKFDTNFGLADHHRSIVPELTYNVVVKREFMSAFLVNITMLLVSMSLLFSLVMMMTTKEALKNAYDLSVSGSIGASAGIFFVVLIAHISLREKFPSSGIVYLEYFYILAYVYILLTALTSYLFNTKTEPAYTGLFKDDAYAIKLLYWPVYFFVLLFITWANFR